MRRMVLASAVALAFSLGLSAPAGSADAPRGSLTAALRQACPQKHFELIGDYDLAGLIEAWETSIQPRDHGRLFDLKMQLQPRCASATGGRRCDNDVDAEAIQGAGLQQSLVTYACSSELTCTAQDECHGSVTP